MTIAIDRAAVAELSARFSGILLGADDAGYDDARRIHNGLIDRRPALIARCRGTADVVDALSFAREQGLEVAVRGGGHNVAGHAVCDGGLMLDLSLLKGVHVDPARRTVHAQGGVIWRELNRETQAHGLAVTGGVISTTGIAGLTLGGGLGWLMGRHGLALDNLLSAEVVTAAGEILHASEREHADLFWALRGGGGNFGVVPWFEYRLHEVGPVTSGFVAHPIDRAREVLMRYREATASAPDELTLSGALLHAPDGSATPVAVIIACHCGTLADAGAALRPVKLLGSAVLDTIGPASYASTNTMMDDSFPRGALNYWKSTFLAELSAAAIDALVAGFVDCPSPMSGLLLEHFHGAAARVGASATAFPHRRVAHHLLIVSEWLDPGDTARNVAWARRMYDTMRPYSTRGRYANYMAPDDGDNPAETAYGENYPRLRAIKARYDPTNLFHLNQNIEPRA